MDKLPGAAAAEMTFTPQLKLAYHPVGGWSFVDVFAKHRSVTDMFGASV
jgi:hypothetical protein